MSNRSVRRDLAHFSFAACCCTFPITRYLNYASIKAKGAFQASSRGTPMGTWTSSLALDVLAQSHLQCFCPHHRIMLHLHHIASALPLQGLSPFFCYPLFLIFPPRHPPLSCVRLVAVGRGMAVSCCADGAARGSGRSAAAAVFDAKVVLGIGKECAMSPARLRWEKKRRRRGNTSVGGNPQQEDPSSAFSP